MENTSGSHTTAAPPLSKQNPRGFQRKEERESETEREAMDDAKISELKQFVNSVKSDPSILYNPSLSFFKSYLQSLGARIPEKPDKCGCGTSDHGEHVDAKKTNLCSEDDKFEDDIVESDIELDDTDVVEPDNDPPQKMGDLSIDVTEENQDAAQMLKSKAMEAISEGKLDEATDNLTEAIMLNPSSAILYATRASVYVKLKKPNAAIRDADAALKINPDSAKGYKIRGMARAMLGLWEEAATDLHVASRLDHDEEIALVLKKVEPNAHKIEEHRRKYARLCKERELRKSGHQKQQQQAQPHDSEAAAAFKDGQVMAIHSSSELETKLKAASKTSRLAILYFTATWCGPCRYISPVFTSLSGKYPKVVFLKVDIDGAQDVAVSWNVSSVPTFFFIKNGKEIDKVVGVDKSALETKIAQYAGQS
ncbi:TPR repeat-containing thioredoxin TDX [Vitis vinifera]|nr:TPR repeat-containing thioredoxin TDX [Vitis vinifera]|eukprot:XP_002282720.2 PREDICTED: TPR repeat-containing thioredoxin TDX [Vitis vinifera]